MHFTSSNTTFQLRKMMEELLSPCQKDTVRKICFLQLVVLKKVKRKFVLPENRSRVPKKYILDTGVLQVTTCKLVFFT